MRKPWRLLDTSFIHGIASVKKDKQSISSEEKMRQQAENYVIFVQTIDSWPSRCNFRGKQKETPA